jgi:hypothetical protein
VKTRVPPEIDALMWALVEQRNDRAIAEFEGRYPEYRHELHRRSTLVTGLKKMKPHGSDEVEPLSPPPFKPREVVRYTTPSRTLLVVGALVLAALGVGSYTLTSMLLPPEKPAAVRQASQPAPTPETRFDEGSVITPPTTNNPAVLLPGDEVGVQPVNKLLVPISVKLEGAPLEAVLMTIGSLSGVEVVIAPGLQNPTVDADFAGMRPLDILQSLGKIYGFTPFDQGNGSVLIIPAREQPSASDGPSLQPTTDPGR